MYSHCQDPRSLATVPPVVRDVTRSPGRPLDADARAHVEPRLRHSFAHVRVHADARAADSAAAAGVLAYTVGQHVVFASGGYDPGSAAGRRLVAYELAHVVQQAGGGAEPAPAPIRPVSGSPRTGSSLGHVHRAVGNQATIRTAGAAGWASEACPSGAAAVITSSAVADQTGVSAVTLGGVVHLASHLPTLDVADRARVLAHEAVHVAQQRGTGPVASRAALEAEAEALSRHPGSGVDPRPTLTADPAVALADDQVPTPKDRLDVGRAIERRKVLLRYKDILEGEQAAQVSTREGLRDRRLRLDRTMQDTLDLLAQASQLGLPTGAPPTVEEYREQERKKLAGLNTRPLTVEVTDTAIRVHVQLQVRFEGPTSQQAAKQFPILEQNFAKSVKDTWERRLPADVLGGRAFTVVPHLTLIASNAARDHAFWLITVRPTDTGPMTYDGAVLGKAPGGVPTSVTDPLVDGGVMSIPPLHITKPDVLGHETLHLFGMVDRYIVVPPALSTTGKQGEQALRVTRARDPLGGQGGTILLEDLGFTMEVAGVYQRIAGPNRLTEGMSLMQVLAELHRVEDIIAAGRDPHSLIPERTDFNREILKSAEDLD